MQVLSQHENLRLFLSRSLSLGLISFLPVWAVSGEIYHIYYLRLY